jgi:hypothetical protein
MAVEMMYSMAYLYRMDGLNHYADMAERPAFNALPAAISPDCESTIFSCDKFMSPEKQD